LFRTPLKQLKPIPPPPPSSSATAESGQQTTSDSNGSETATCSDSTTATTATVELSDDSECQNQVQLQVPTLSIETAPNESAASSLEDGEVVIETISGSIDDESENISLDMLMHIALTDDVGGAHDRGEGTSSIEADDDGSQIVDVAHEAKPNRYTILAERHFDRDEETGFVILDEGVLSTTTTQTV
jgi:hypothetical protein